MKKQLLFIVAGLLLLLATLWLLKIRPFTDQYSAKNEPASVTSPAQSSTAKANADPVKTHPTDPINQTVAQPTKSKAGQMQEAWDAENSKSLSFYGKVIDQYGAAVVGVEIKAGVGLILSFERSGGKDYYTETDHNGRFSFIGIQGAGAGFTLTREGYFYNQRLPSASRSADYVPDPDHPVIFPIWKLKGAEPMVHIEAHCGLAVDGTATSFDLLTGKKTSSGDLAIRLVRNPVNIDRSKPFDWTLTLQVNGGGLIPVETTYTNEAPVEGYKSSVTVSMSASEKNWSPSLVQTYFFKARNGQVYGRITANLMANYQPAPTHFEFEVYANPSGSRNLEFDPAKVVKP